MDLRLSSEQERVRAAVAELAARHAGAPEDQPPVEAVLRDLAGLGALSWTLGDRPDGHLLAVLAADELGRHLLRGLYIDTLAAREAAPSALDAETPAALAVLDREPPALDERLRITGRARFVAHAGRARRLLLRAAGPAGDPVLLLLAAPRAGMALRRHDEISRGDLYEVALDQAAAGEAEVLQRGAPAAAALERVRWALRLRQAAYMVGMAQGALDATMSYVRQRQAFGRRLASFQALAFRIAALHVRVEATRLLVRSVACRAADDDVRLAATQAHAVAAALAMDSAAEGVQMHGAVGITDRSIVQRFYRHASVEHVRLGRPADLLDEAAALLAERARRPEEAPVEARR